MGRMEELERELEENRKGLMDVPQDIREDAQKEICDEIYEIENDLNTLTGETWMEQDSYADANEI